jgi:hypothetical protein
MNRYHGLRLIEGRIATLLQDYLRSVRCAHKMIHALVLLFLLAGPAYAWNEPASFAGMQFGKDVRELLPKCEDGAQKYLYGESRPPCWTQHRQWLVDETKLSIWYLKIDNALFEVDIEQPDFRLEYVSGSFPRYKFKDILTLFVAKYGQPTSKIPAPYQNAFGASFTYWAYQWNGKNVSIFLTEAPLNLHDTMGWFSFTTGARARREAAEKKQKTDKAIKDF